jgi:hypothetical protein
MIDDAKQVSSDGNFSEVLDRQKDFVVFLSASVARLK